MQQVTPCFDELLSAVPGVLWTYNVGASRYLWVSPAAPQFLGFPRETWLEPGFWSRSIHPEDRARVELACRESWERNQEHRLSYRMVRADGRTIHVTDQARLRTLEDGSRQLFGLLIDVTEQQERTERLRAHDELFQTIVQSMHDLIFTFSADHKITSLMGAAGAPERRARLQAFVGRTLSELLGPAAGAIHEEAFARVIRGERFQYEYTSRVLEPGTPARTFHIELFPLLRAHPGGIAGVGISREITTERRHAEDLRAQKALLEAQAEASPDGILLVDHHGRIVLSNRRFREMWRLPPEVLVSESDERLIEAVLEKLEDPDAFRARVRHLYLHPAESSVEEFALQDGRIFEVFSGPMPCDGPTAGRAWFFRDVTERKRMESRLAVADRMASLGTLVAGVAHEVNNPLAYLMASLQFLQSALPDQANDAARKELVAALEDALDGANRVARIVKDLRAFSRVNGEKLEPLDLHEVLDAVTNLTRSEVAHRARLVREYGDIEPVIGIRQRLVQAFLNLVVNAAHAIEAGAADRHEIRITTRRRKGGGVEVQVRDTGKGIPPANLGRIFDPFFTTKAVGEGTGLGLSIAHAIVAAHEGEISAQSEVGRGTTFTVVLPLRAMPQALEPVQVPAAAPEAPLPQRRVLLIDDDALIRRAFTRTLEASFHVVAVAGGGEALEVLQRDTDFDAILCDVMMPSMTGEQFYERLRETQPQLLPRVIFMTGGSFTPQTQRLLAESGCPMIEKPIDLAQLQALLLGSR